LVRVALHAAEVPPGLLDELELRGFTVATCAVHGAACPALRGEPCLASARADVIVCAGDTGYADIEQLVLALRTRHRSTPIVVAGASLDPQLLEVLGEPWVVTFVGNATADRLRLTIEEAMGGTPEAMIGIVD
jgi:hypothetical protein